MATLRLISLALLALACRRADMPPPNPLAQFAGTWDVSSRRESGDSVIGFRLTATADTTGWTFQFAGRPPMPIRIVDAGGDSVAGEVAPYESVLRPGVQVRTSFVLHQRAGRLEGTTTARYSVAGPDSVLVLRNAGVRLP